MDKIKRKSMIKVRGGFSDRIGKPTCTTTIQLNEFDDHTRVQIGNQLFQLLDFLFSNSQEYSTGKYQDPAHSISSDFCKSFRANVLGYSVFLRSCDVIPWEHDFDKIDNVILEAPYNEVLDTIEYCYTWIASRTDSLIEKTWQRSFNMLFQQEYVGYRFIAGKIVPITDKIEMQEIEKACQTFFEGARTQLQKALGFLSDREHPDYKNCVKESISAVESVCETIVGSDNGATLGKAVKHLEEHGLKIHSSLREGISKLYGYACDQGGVRHGEGEVESTVTFEEAKLMMVTCSAIVNYLVSEYGKYGAENA